MSGPTPPVSDLKMTVMNETSTFIKKMASPDEKIRDRAVRTVQTFLSKKGDSLSYDEFLKLWKGFFYCFWLSDKTDGQFNLAELICKLVHNLPFEKKGVFAESGSALFLRSFWETMGREWPRLDRLRLNKYYSLMKHMIHQSFQMIAIASETEESSLWNPEIVKGHNAILLGTVFDRSNRAYPESIRSYVIENYFELLKSSSAEPFSAEMTVLVCEPIIHAVAYCDNKAFFKQASEALIQGLLPDGDNEEDGCGEECADHCGEDCADHCGEDCADHCGEDCADHCGHDCDDDSKEDCGDCCEMSDCGDCCEMSDCEELESIDDSNSENVLEDSDCSENSDEEANFDSEEFDKNNDVDGNEKFEGSCCSDDDHDHNEEDEVLIFDYSLLSKFIFDFGAREDVLVRNRRFLYELSQIIEEVSTWIMKT